MATKVFISWSGELSRQLAEAVREWLPGALQFVKPYFTPEDIEKGARWGSDIVKELESSDIGIVCLTHTNTDSPWILFEAGALSKSLEKSRVCGVLFGLDTTDLKGPLTIFQHTRFQRADFKKLVKTINAAGGEAKLEDNVFDSVFDMWWPRLEEKVTNILNSSNPDGEASNRSERDILEEILELSRLNTRNRKSEREIPPEIIMELVEGIEMMMMKGGMRSTRAIHFIERPLMMLADFSGHPEIHELIFRMRSRFEMERKPTKEDT
ncbi:MAG: TIR domain-containing protein [Planctomycetaceae bacterium]|nr:TIR domain-containing protein [Planctomycetales bacterium]MCB9924196.1 TIR domain-containing protein [Planctomycetaceae bacterium]